VTRVSVFSLRHVQRLTCTAGVLGYVYLDPSLNFTYHVQGKRCKFGCYALICYLCFTFDCSNALIISALHQARVACMNHAQIKGNMNEMQIVLQI
jgi:hypothetical protein